MKAKIDIMNYKGERNNIIGDIEVNKGVIELTIPELGVTLTGYDVDRDTTEKVILKGSTHEMELDWKNTFKLSGRWRSNFGAWKTTTITIKDLKEESRKTWWDREDFSDMAVTGMLAMGEKRMLPPGISLKSDQKVNASIFKILKTIGPYFSPYYAPKHTDRMNEDLKIKAVRSMNIDSPTDDHYNPPMINLSGPIPKNVGIYSLTFPNKQDNTPIDYSSFSKEAQHILNSCPTTDGILRMVFLKPTILNKRIYMDPGPGITYDKFEFICREEGGLLPIWQEPIKIDFANGIIRGCHSKLFNKALIEACEGTASDDVAEYVWEKDTFNSFELAYVTMTIEESIRRDALWTVRSSEGPCHATFGVNHEQLKTLFALRTGPKTPSGRLRAIQHWIREYQRIKKAGITIENIPKSLRGETRFEMFGAKFEIINPIRRHWNEISILK